MNVLLAARLVVEVEGGGVKQRTRRENWNARFACGETALVGFLRRLYVRTHAIAKRRRFVTRRFSHRSLDRPGCHMRHSFFWWNESNGSTSTKSSGVSPE